MSSSSNVRKPRLDRALASCGVITSSAGPGRERVELLVVFIHFRFLLAGLLLDPGLHLGLPGGAGPLPPGGRGGPAEVPLHGDDELEAGLGPPHLAPRLPQRREAGAGVRRHQRGQLAAVLVVVGGGGLGHQRGGREDH